MRRIVGWLGAALLLMAVPVVAVSASHNAPSQPVKWITYSNAALGYSLSYPDSLYQEGDLAEVFFSTRGPIPFLQDLLGEAMVVVRWEDEEEGLRRGTWFGNDPVADVVLGGVAGKEYVYFHRDPFKATRVVAFVIPYRGRFLGLEFRSEGELDEVQQRVLASFELSGK
jgi:hypothetical protein